MTDPLPHTYAVIMAGGSGTRFWPLSRSAAPKQLSRIVGDATMIQATVARLQPLVPTERILVITTRAQAEEARRQLPMLPGDHVIAEPVGRDTAAAVALAAVVVRRLDPAATMILLPADQVISPADAFQHSLATAVQTASGGSLVTCGIKPRFAATGYGYIKCGARRTNDETQVVHEVERFVEKPDAETAASYLADGGYLWNGGIFTWRADVVLDELARHCSWLTEAILPLAEAWGTPQWDERLEAVYGPLQKISIDYALMEHADDITVVTADFDWDDVGSWDALYDHLPADEHGVISEGDALAIECGDCLIVNRGGPTVAAVGVSELTIVSTADAVLVCRKGAGQGVKQIVDRLQAEDRGELL